MVAKTAFNNKDTKTQNDLHALRLLLSQLELLSVFVPLCLCG